MLISVGGRFLMYRFRGLVVLVYIINTLRHRDGGQRRPRLGGVPEQSAARDSIKAGTPIRTPDGHADS